MNLKQKLDKIFNMLKSDERFIGMDVVEDEMIRVFVKDTVLYNEIQKPFKEILGVEVLCGRKHRR